MTESVVIETLTAEAFAPFGDVIEIEGAHQFEINDGFTTRVHDLFQPDLQGTDTRVLVNFFLGRPRPLTVSMLERHPYGSQAFIPMDRHDWWVVVASEASIDSVRVFRARGDQGVNYHTGTWHHPLLVDQAQQFLVVDRQGQEKNCDEVHFNRSLSWKR
ncbi:MAG: ureidoglycolate lyase [Litorivicinus sp.]